MAWTGQTEIIAGNKMLPTQSEEIMNMGSRVELADRMVREARIAFAQMSVIELLWKSSASATKEVKKFFGDLGKTLDFKVAAAGFPKFDEGEWRYDMVWYALDNDGFQIRLPMVLECEWNPDVTIDTDFQKLVQARADVRVWIAALGNPDRVRQHLENCKKQIQLFSGSCPGDTYIFIICDWTTTKTVIERFEFTAQNLA